MLQKRKGVERFMDKMGRIGSPVIQVHIQVRFIFILAGSGRSERKSV